jgi:hypothetical protein
VTKESKAEVASDFFNNVLATPPSRVNAISLHNLDFTHLDLTPLWERFTEEEVWAMISVGKLGPLGAGSSGY